MAGAIKQMRSSSSPGMGGLPAALYLLGPEPFGKCLKIVFEYHLERGILHRPRRHLAITLL